MSGPWERFQSQAPTSKPWERFVSSEKRTGIGIGAAIDLGIDIAKKGADEAKRAGYKPPAPKIDPEEARRDKVRNAEIKDLQSSDGILDRANDFLLRGRYSFESGADRVVAAVQGGLGFRQAAEETLRAARRKREVANTEISGQTTWDEVKANPLVAPKFIYETGLESLPGMAVAATGVGGLGIFAASQTGNIGQQRAENDGREDATAMDMVKAAPAAVASAALERLGITGIIGSTGKNAAVRIGKAGATEAITEFGQSAIEYTGGTLGTDAGYRLDEMLDQSFAGAVGGFGVGAGIRGVQEGVTAPFRRPVAPGKREKALQTSTVKQTDVDSPLPTEAIIAGRNAIADATGMQEADNILKSAGMPATGKRVSVAMPNGQVKTGTVEDAFDEDVEGERAAGVKIRFDDGTALREHFETLADAGVTVTQLDNRTAEEIDADLKQRAEQPLGVDSAPAEPGALPVEPVAQEAPRPRKGKGVPVNNAKAITEELFPGAVVTSWSRSANDPLTKKNPGSWHAKSKAAVDVRPIKGMTFEQFVQRYRDAGYTILEAINETGKGKTKHATGDHWHIVLGKPGGTDAEIATPEGMAQAAAPVASAEPSAIEPRGIESEGGIVQAPAILPPVAARTEDRTDVVATATGREVNVRYAVIEAADLKPSNLPDGRVNPVYPADRQPRDRTRAASKNQVNNIASNLKPYWLGRTVRPDDGAPIIAPNGVVESGNGRSMALQQVYQEGGAKAEEYRRFVENQGIDTAGIEQPVLVRIREDQFSPEEERAFAREANMPTALGMAPTEQAMADADALPPALMAQYQGGDVDMAANSAFVRGFMQQIMSPQEAAQMQASDGRPNKTAFVRIRNALLAQAYDNPQLVENVAESLDTNIAAIGGALTDVAGSWAQMKDAAKKGQIPASLDITANLNEAVNVIDRARREKMKVQDIVDQRNMFTGESVDPVTEAVLRLFFARPDFTKPAGRSRVTKALQEYVDQAMAQRLDQGAMLDADPIEAPSGLLNQAKVKQGYVEAENPDAATATDAAEPAAPAGERAQVDVGNDNGSGGESLPPVSEQQTTLDVEPAPKRELKAETTSTKDTTGLAAVGNGLAGAMGANLRSSLLKKVDAGVTTEGGQPSALLQIAKRIRSVGVTVDEAILSEIDRGIEAARGGSDYQGDLQKLVKRLSGNANGDGLSQRRDIEAAVAEVDTNPTDAQKEAGNYRKGHVTVQGLDITIENPKGSERSGKDPNGKAWSVTMPAHYGYVKGSKGADGEQVDVYIGDDLESRRVFIVDQKDADTGEFDEHKVMLGFSDMDAAEETYRAGFSDGKGGQRIGGMTEMSIDEFQAWLQDEQTAPVADDPQPSEVAVDDNLTDGDTKKPEAKIEDFGERLEGARKHYAEAFGVKIRDASKLDIASAPLSQTWPEPDYQKLLDDGADEYSVAAMRAMRDSIPARPKRYGLSAWVKQTEMLRALAMDMLENGGISDRFREKLEGDFKRALSDLQGSIDLYREFGHAQSFKGISFGSHFYSLYRGEKNVTKWSISKKAKASAYSNWPRELAVGNTREEVLSRFREMLGSGELDKKKSDIIRFDIYSYRNKPGFYVGKKIGSNYVDLRHFDTAKDARAYKISEEGYAELVAELEKAKFIPNERKETNSPRIGINHRNGADVTTQQFAEAFGFRGVQFGNYVEGPRRQQDLNEAFDALMDMAGVLGVPPKALSLNGTLGLAFGARGKGGKNPAKAHYEPGNIVINLTKTAGAGSLAHEWWHSLDNYFGTKRGITPYVTEATGRNETGGMRPEMLQAFRDVMSALRSTALKERSRQLDKLRSKEYWSTDIEMSARAFESYVIAKLQDEQFSNDYLANVVSEAAFGRESGYPYPTAAEIDTVRAGFDKFFETIESRETGAGVELFSIPDVEPVATLTGEEMGRMPKNQALRIKIMRDRAINWYRSNLAGKTVTGSDGAKVTFGRAGMKKSTSGKGEDLLRALPALRDLIEKGAVRALPQNRDEMKAYLYAGTVQVSGEEMRLAVIVREDANGRRHYDLTKDTGKKSVGSPAEAVSAVASDLEMEVSSDADINLFVLDEESNNAAPVDDAKQSILAELQDRLQQLGIQEKIALRVVDRLGARTAGTFDSRWTMDDEKFLRGTISIALDAPQPRDVTLNHEAIHAMRSLGLFRDAEWAAMSRRARADLQLMRSIKRRYSGLSEEAQTEEAVADMFAAWVKERNQKGLVSKAFDRILAFVTAFTAWAKGRGWTSAEDVMRGIDSGKLARRGTVEQVASDAQNAENVKDANYEEASDALMGFASDQSRQKPFGANRYPIELDVRIDLDGDVFEDTIEGLNKTHAVERARRNWPGANIEAIGEPRKVAKASLFDEPVQPQKTMTDKQRAELEARQKQSMARRGGQQGLGDQDGGLFSSERDQGLLFSIVDDETAMPSGFNRNAAGENLFELHFGAVNDMLNSINDGKSKSFDKVSKAWDEFRIKVQDRFLPLLRLQQAVERDIGRPLAENSNPYMGEELMSGKIGAKLEALNNDHVQPLYDALVESDVSLDELETYLYARHAPERNKRISEINPLFEEGSGSGMTDIEAAAIMNRIEQSGKMEQMKALAARVDGMLNEAVKARVDAGLMSEQDAATWREHYKHYVPLRGRAEIEGGTLEPARSNSGQSGISVKGKESRRAFGRRSKADNIIAYSILQAQEAIARSEKNRVARQFYELAKQAPDPNFWQIDKIERRPIFNKAKGQVEYQSQSRISAEDAPYTVSVKIDGVEHRVTMNRDNPAAVKLATAMRNLTAQKMGWLVNIAGSINRFLSAVNTSYNPEFIVVNAFRDLQAASINLGQVEQAGMVRGVLKDYRKALAASIRGGFGASKGEWGEWYREFVSQGGRTFFNQFDDLDQIKGRIERQMKLASDRATGRMSVRRGFEEVLDFVEKANNGVENAIRLSAYKNAREAGLSKAQAASLAKNITVNFNRRGEWGAGINALYLFFNASVQGTATILNAAKSKRVQKVLGAIVISGAVMEMLNAALSDDDDDGESFYDKISDFDKSRNLIIMLPGQNGKFIKIPMPYGYNAIFGLGRGLAEIGRRGGDRWQESLATIAQTGVDAFNPIGGTQSLLNLIAPTIVDPIVDLFRNRDFADRPIMPEQSSFEVPDPDAQRYFGSVAPHWKAITDFLTDVTGGDEVQAGAIDVSPETLEYLQGVFFGAAGQFFDRNLGLAQKLVSSDPADEISANDFSFYRKVVGDVPPWREKSVFYERMRAVEQVIDDAKDYEEREDLEGLERLVADNEKLASLEGAVKSARKDMRAIRKERGATELAYDLGKIDDATYNEERALFKQAEDMVIAEFNTQWVATMKNADSTGD